ncbi:DUF1127 domain-containing protein [Aliiruegeria lutimaris]|uniref:YjiS-like domain-containing protein n=1 Tax=Aliiruegeria lutimaris TaxID=571298 RepID=A0A1G8XTL3_9RHOB|nr:DUF1127 domain-containing protein [Aliiruegeria lutimaris]SDJ93827.1 protein of unknown function [Aliiruegeria lutimaris]
METTYTANSTTSWFSAPIEALRVNLQKRKIYRQTYCELSSLSDRALADLGLSRSMIKSLAREAAYGA